MVSAILDKVKVFLIIKKHLCDNIISALVNFLFKILHVDFHIGSFKVLFRVSSHPYAKV